MNGPLERVYQWLTDETNVTLLVLVAVVVLGGGSLLIFFLSGTGSPTRFEFGLLAAAMAIFFYLTLRSSSF